MRIVIIFLFSSVLCFGQTPIVSEQNNVANEAIFTEAMAAFLIQDYQVALRHFDTFLKVDQNSAAGYYMKSRVEKAMGMQISSEISAEKAVQLDKNQVYYLLNYGEVLRDNNKIEQAVDIYKTVTKQRPDQIEHYLILAELQNENEQYTEALNTYDLIEKQFGSNNEIALAKQKILIKTNKVNIAVKEVDKSNNFDPEFTLSQVKLLVENNREKQAVKILEKAIEDHPPFEAGVEQLAGIYKETHAWTDLHKLVGSVIGDNDLSGTVKVTLAEYMLDTPYKLSSDIVNNLIESLSRELEVSGDARGYRYLGDLYLLRNDRALAVEQYRSSLKKDRNQYGLWLESTRLKYILGDFNGMEKIADEATIYFPNHPELWVYLGLAQLLNENTDEAGFSIEQIEFLNPRDETKDNWLVLKQEYENQTKKSYQEVLLDNEYTLLFKGIHLIESDASQAQKILLDLTLKFPENITYKAILAQAYLKGEKHEDAEKILSEIEEKEMAASALSLEVKGDLFAAIGQSEEARKLWTAAQKINRSSKTLRNKLR